MEKYKNMKIGTSPMTGAIFLGKLNKKGNMWLDGKTDVTDEVICAMVEHLRKVELTYTYESIDSTILLLNSEEMECLRKFRESKKGEK